MMKKLYILVILGVLVCFAALQAAPLETYFKFHINSKEELSKLTKIISIDNVKDFVVYAYANEEQLREFERMGYAYEVLPHPGTLYEAEMAYTKDGMKDWAAYPTYTGYVDMMNQFAADYPDLCEIVLLDTPTVYGRTLMFAKISDNVSIEEDEPEVMYTSTMHGNETTGYVLMLRLIDSLLVGYGTDSLITRMVDSCEIWINPLANPDGTYGTGNTITYPTRGNANGKDLNRNFPDPDDGPNPGGTWQPETIAMMEIAEAQNFVISGNLHGGAELINYPWDTWARRHADDSFYIKISRQFADTAQAYSPSGYLTDENYGITNGYDWYSIEGGRQDYMNYWHGCREVTMEISSTHFLPASQLPAYWGYLRIAFLDWLEQGLYGIRGIVTDNSTGLPLLAMIRVLDYDYDPDSSMVYTDPDVGNYHRMLRSGTYDLEFSAPGYYIDTVSSISVIDLQSTRVDVALVPLPDEPDLYFIGHNAGTIDPGDVVLMNIVLANAGAGISYNTFGTLSSDDTYITVTQDTSSWPAIGALGGQATSSSQFRFVVSSYCPLNYQANFRLDVTAEGYYTDSIFFSLYIGLQIEDFESAGFASYPYEMSGDADWAITNSFPYEGVYSAKSGVITHSQETNLSLTADILSSGNISFYYKVSSESGWDYLRFYIDGSPQGEWSGSVGWTEVSYPVSVGTHTFMWQYEKDNGSSSGSDCGWIDYIIFPPLAFNPQIITGSLPNWTAAHPYSQQLEATGGIGNLSWFDKNNDLDGTGLTLSESGLLSGTPFAVGTISFTALVTDAGSGSNERVFSFEINPILVITTTDLPDWTQGRIYVQQLQSSGGTGSKTWGDRDSELNGTGLTLSSNGLLSGIPISAGDIHFTASVIDQVDASNEREFDFTINPTMVITEDTLTDAIVGREYSYQLTCTGGTGQKTWRDKYNYLDGSGLSVSDDGLVSGIPISPSEGGFYAEVEDETGSAVNKPLFLTILAGYTCGDANSDEEVNVSDGVYIINYVFAGGNPPNPMEAGDANCDGTANVSDAVFIINYVFVGGSAPCDTNGDGDPDC